jgi:RNA polymerase sigma-70 factor (ECF subfamily)
MSTPHGPLTSLRLLEELRRDPADERAWGEFVHRYRGRIHAWCREWGLQPADADDVTQIVLVKLTDKLREFHYDPAGSFRAWLRTVTQHAWSDFLRLQPRTAGSGDSHVWRQLDSVEARADLEQRLADAFDQELLGVAMLRVRRRVAAQTWEAFRLTALEGRPGVTAAKELGMPVAHVFVAKHRVQKLLRKEVRYLDDGTS